MPNIMGPGTINSITLNIDRAKNNKKILLSTRQYGTSVSNVFLPKTSVTENWGKRARSCVFYAQILLFLFTNREKQIPADNTLQPFLSAFSGKRGNSRIFYL
jgi:hypothetical protein